MASWDPARVVEKNFAHRRAHGYFEYARAHDVSAHTDEFQSAGTAEAGVLEPLDAARQDLRHVRKGLDVVNDRGLLPQAHLSGEGRFISGFGAVAFDGFDQGAFLAADITAGADKNFQIEIHVAAQDSFP